MTRSYIRLAGAAAMLWAAAAQAAPTTEEKIDLLSEELERLKAEVARKDSGPMVDKATRTASTTVGGYGELHYNNLDSKKEIDFHRFVLFFGHKFTERLRLFSELELEHSNTESGGAVELEQAYLEFDLSERLRARGGLFLMPVGIINETHEPPTFYGVERNPVERHVIPATWWEGGAALSGSLGTGFSTDVAITSGLKIATSGDAAWNIREARQNVAEASADSLGYIGRLRWAGVPGLEIVGSLYYQNDLTQSVGGVAPVRATLGEGHVVFSKGSVTVKVLYAQWHLTGGDGVSNPAMDGSDVQNGWYVEPSYKITPKWGVFARYNEFDNRAGNLNSTKTERRQTDLGVNYWPHPQVVIKFDVQNQQGASNDDGFNLGIGYMF